MDENEREIGGNHQSRRFAYLHKKDHSKFGLLLATDQRNARDHLGKQFHIKATWLNRHEWENVDFDRALRWEIVSSIFRSRNLAVTGQNSDPSEDLISRLRKRVTELEAELESLTECTQIEIKESGAK